MELLRSIYNRLLGKEKLNKYRLAQIAEIAFAYWPLDETEKVNGENVNKYRKRITQFVQTYKIKTKTIFIQQIEKYDKSIIGKKVHNVYILFYCNVSHVVKMGSVKHYERYAISEHKYKLYF